jgi:hypothetical protein
VDSKFSNIIFLSTRINYYIGILYNNSMEVIPKNEVCKNPDFVINELDVDEETKDAMREMIAELYQEQTEGK